MKPSKNNITSIDGYISQFPKDIQAILEQIRQTVKQAAPDAEELISYQMPAFKQHKNIVYFAAFKNHIGFFPTTSAVKKFNKELMKYETSKGTIKFPLDKKIPLALISKITKFRVKEELKRKKEMILKNQTP